MMTEKYGLYVEQMWISMPYSEHIAVFKQFLESMCITSISEPYSEFSDL